MAQPNEKRPKRYRLEVVDPDWPIKSYEGFEVDYATGETVIEEEKDEKANDGRS